ncbi:ABC transporter ATP-binding protein [Oceanicella sp. SM1341]|uniref:ABC transporter ATP-binding protein n=1 Tax=Oceanicella sp. SM1341 TaxID=1548889 RepID=UPI001300454B|nr:ABC transporter ATP-binding protein [Oceanicella sp. SM1341]
MRLVLGGSEIYRDVSFDVGEGEFVCLLGPSGCGKSTALRLIGDLLPIQAGAISVGGASPRDAWDQTAFVFQSPRLLPWKTTLENAGFGIEMRKPAVPKAERLARAERELAHVGLGADGHKMPVMLSGGERQRVSIARALALDPRIILMDEPFSALDHTTRARLRRQIVELWQETGKTVLFVTHDIDEALYLADRIVVFSRKPTTVSEVVEVRAPRPRDTEADPALQQLRAHLIEVFERLEGAPDAPEEAEKALAATCN